MIYLNILIGFCLIMLIFASTVSVAQSMLKRLLSLKGQAVVEPLLQKLRELWAQSELPPDAFDKVAAALRSQLATVRGKHVRTLHAASVGERALPLALLRHFGKTDLSAILSELPQSLDLGWKWNQLIARLEADWESIGTLQSACYKRHTARGVLCLSVATVLMFNVDVIRIMRLLSVDPDLRTALLKSATTTAGSLGPADQEPAPAGYAKLATSDWAQQNLKELQTDGLPLGWSAAPLWLCGSGSARTTATYGSPCSGPISYGATIFLWLVRLLGLVLGAGLVAQGAPFWYTLLNEVLGIRRLGSQGSAAAAISDADTDNSDEDAAAAGQSGDTGNNTAGVPPAVPASGSASSAESVPGPILITDIYAGEAAPSWRQLVAAKSFTGAILKATDGVRYPSAASWFVPQWQAARKAAGGRYREQFFLGAYHWLQFYEDPEQQANFYCETLEEAGWGPGDLLPIVDVEFGSDGPHPAPNDRAREKHDTHRVVDCTIRFAEQIRRRFGQDTRIVLYSGQVLKELKIAHRMGCDYLWTAQYRVRAPNLQSHIDLGWPDADIVMWQYTDGQAGNNATTSPKLEENVPGLGRRDCSIFRGGDLAAFRAKLVVA